MSFSSVLRLLLLSLCVLVSPAMANLTQLAVSFSPDQETFYEGETISVTAVTDNIASPEYRFVLQLYGNDSWLNVGETAWSSSDQLTVTDAWQDPPPGNYRLITYARDASNPDEFILNYQTFFYQTTVGLEVCDWLDGKTFVTEGPTAQVEVAVNAGGVTTVMLPFDPDADKFESMSFDGGASTLAFAEPFEVFFSLFGSTTEGEGELVSVDPLTGTYSCADNVVSVAASGSFTEPSSGVLVPVESSGDAVADMEAGTLTANGVVFRIKNSGEANAPGTGGSSGGGSGVLLAMLLLLGLVRRR